MSVNTLDGSGEWQGSTGYADLVGINDVVTSADGAVVYFAGTGPGDSLVATVGAILSSGERYWFSDEFYVRSVNSTTQGLSVTSEGHLVVAGVTNVTNGNPVGSTDSNVFEWWFLGGVNANDGSVGL